MNEDVLAAAVRRYETTISSCVARASGKYYSSDQMRSKSFRTLEGGRWMTSSDGEPSHPLS
jgi:hypothetical protein